MKDISSLVQSILEKEVFKTFFLLKMTFEEIEVLYTSFYRDLTIDTDVYESDNGIVSFDQPKVSSIIDKETFKIQIADPAYYFRSYCNGMTGGKIILRSGFISPFTTPIYSTGDIAESNPINFDLPILDYLDTVILYQGTIDKPSYEISEESGIILNLECSSPMGSLDSVNPFYTTTFSLYQRIPSGTVDTCFEEILLGGKSQEIKWGRVPYKPD